MDDKITLYKRMDHWCKENSHFLQAFPIKPLEKWWADKQMPEDAFKKRSLCEPQCSGELIIDSE